jgi:uncharacterized membrane protein
LGWKLGVALSAFMLIQIALVQPAFGEGIAVPESLSFTVYVDGYVFVDYTVRVDAESPEANITVFGQVMSDMLVVDGENLPLDYSSVGAQLLVYTLGVDKVKISYFTQDLTEKDGRFWTLNVTTPADSTILMPAEATIVDFNEVPDLIETSGDQILLLMPAGQVELEYVIGVVGTREYAQIVLSAAEQTINEVKALNVTVTSAETTLQQAWESFNSGSYTEAETLANQAKDSAIQTNQTAAQALSAMDAAGAEIERAEEEGRTVGLGEARNLLTQSESAYAEGNYTQALSLASESQGKAQESAYPPTSPPTISASQFGVGEAAGIVLIAAVAVVTGFVVFKIRQRSVALRQAQKKKALDVERILRRNDLRREEKEAVRIMVDNKGEVLEAELYSKLNLPRTTTWRLVRRLEKMGVVEVTKNRRDNVVRLKK